MPDDVMEIADLVIELFPHTHRLSVLLIQQNSELANNSEHKVLAHPPSELWVEDGSVLWIGEDHQAVVSELLCDQSLVSFADVKLVDVTLDQGLECLWAQE